ncbi:hypothetical protein GCM10023191_035080 [Actinoallomurus oryzae]|uniref:Uncharacterized protein n=1 Tax=Actinoallomurus oryzae TaxID=502180 RepID=A0ABP8Q191_9ACTN
MLSGRGTGFLDGEYAAVAGTVRSADRFRVIVRVRFIAAYGNQVAVPERAFADALPPIACRGRIRRPRALGRRELSARPAPPRPQEAAGARTPRRLLRG